MAKAGLYLPSDPHAAAASSSSTSSGAVVSTNPQLQQQQQGRATSAGRSTPPQLLWFDRVLADIGDAQDLQQNLSTFSGHIRRIKQILGSATPRSLVLLDEVGSGTDPLEGAALARAILDSLAARAGLTFATTHHAELKTAPEEDPRYVNVSMGFDVATLRPTYCLAWGSAGASNALDIAKALGFDSAVVRDARSVAKDTLARERDRVSHLEAVATSLVRQLEDAREELAAQRRLREERERRAEELRGMASELTSMRAALKASPRAIVKERDSLQASIATAIEQYLASKADADAVEAAFKEVEKHIPGRIAQAQNRTFKGGVDAEADPQKGDLVYVAKYGDLGEAVVESVSGQYVRVQLLNAVTGMMGVVRGPGKLPKLRKSEVRVLKRAADIGPAGLMGLTTGSAGPLAFAGGGGLQQGYGVDGSSATPPEFRELMQEVQEVLREEGAGGPLPPPSGGSSSSGGAAKMVMGGGPAATAAKAAGWEVKGREEEEVGSDEDDLIDFSDYDTTDNTDYDTADDEDQQQGPPGQQVPRSTRMRS